MALTKVPTYEDIFDNHIGRVPTHLWEMFGWVFDNKRPISYKVNGVLVLMVPLNPEGWVMEMK